MSKARDLSNFISDATVDASEIADLAVTHAKLHTDMNLSSKTLTFAANQISGNAIGGGVISNFASTGIDDNASATAVTILSDGNVGIGTSSPEKKLHVHSGVSSDIVRFANDSGSFTIGKTAGLGSLDMASDANFRIRHGSTISTTFKSDGNVGIGTSSPSTKLTVRNDNSSTAFGDNNILTLQNLNTTDNNRYGIGFTGNTNIGSGLALIEAQSYDQSQGHTSLNFSVYNGSWHEDMMVLKAGNVGIGQTDPQGDLHIGNISGSKDIIMHATNNGNARIKFREGGSNASGFNEYSIGMVGNRNALTVEGQGAGEFLTLMGDTGNVGIGATDPSDKLTVSGGHINLTSSAYGIKLPGAITSDGQINHANAGSEVTLQTYPLSNQTLRLKGLTDKIYYHSDRGNPDYGEVFGIDTYGRVTMPYQPAFQAQAIANDTTYGNGVIPYPGVIVNRGSHYSNSTYRFTAPVSGAYCFSWDGWHNASTSGTGRMFIRKNGSYVRTPGYSSGQGLHARLGDTATDDDSQMTAILELSAGDYVDIYSGEGDVRMFYSSGFSGFLIG